MKKRKGFVSNSSSSSFIVSLDVLSARQLRQILEQARVETDSLYSDKWDINIGVDSVEFYTLMDNFDMHHFLTSIGVKEKDIKCGS